jgi:flagellar hook protein FlgE
MLLSLDSGISALGQFQQKLNVIANNIANVETVGYKSASINFADTLSQTLSGPSPAGTMQIGTGIHTASITNEFTQGATTSTGSPSDLMINGGGFFMVKDSSTGNSYVTRDGHFAVDSSGYLINSSGMRVQGYTDGTLSSVGDIQITNNTGSAGKVESYSFGTDGKITVKLSDSPNPITRGQILLQDFTSPQQLLKVGNNLYSGLSLAGPLAAPVAPGSSGLGEVNPGLEMSNVDLAHELTSLITTQRAYEANSKVITTSDEILQTLVNLKR